MAPSKNDRERCGSNKGKKDARSVECNTDIKCKLRGSIEEGERERERTEGKS